MTADEERYLRHAIALARAARSSGNPPFGSLLVGPDGGVLAEERNSTVTDADITAHPELKLARWAGRELAPATAAATTMYTSCQPCPMCTAAIERSGLGRVVFALSSEQLHSLQPADRPAPSPVRQQGPALPDEAQAAVAGYYR